MVQPKSLDQDYQVSHCKFLGVIAFITCASPCFSAELKASDIEVVAVIPRNQDVKPYAIAIPTDGQRSAMETRKEREEMVAKSRLRDTVATESALDRRLPAPAVGNSTRGTRANLAE